MRIRLLMVEMDANICYDGRKLVEWAKQNLKDKHGKPLSHHQASADVKVARDRHFADLDLDPETNKKELILSLKEVISRGEKDRIPAARLLADICQLRTKKLIIEGNTEAPLIFQQHQAKLLDNQEIRDLACRIDEVQGRLDDLDTTSNKTTNSSELCEDGEPGMVQDSLLAVLPPAESPGPAE